MHRVRVLFSLPLFLFAACSENIDDAAVTETDAEDTRITFGEVRKIQSSILSEERELWIRVPDSANDPDERNTAYPVVYLLDGNGHFYSMAGMLHQLSAVNGNMVSPEMILVGIPNTDRFRDLTPTQTEGTSGGGDAFLDFLEVEVVPYIENNFPASSYRTFIGHSLGGLMVIDTLNSRPHLFDNYIAIDPSLWWDDRTVLRESEVALADQDFSGKSLFVTIANTMPAQMSVDQVAEDTKPSTNHIRAILRYTQLADAADDNGLNFGWRYYDENSHGSVPLISEYDGIRFLFPWYEPKEINHFFAQESTPETQLVMDYVTNHFAGVSDRFGYTFHPPQGWVNMLGRSMTARDQSEGALALFNLNLQNYPNSRAAHYWLGDYYASQDDTENAIRHFTHAVEIGEAPQSAQRLAELQSASGAQ